MASSVRVPRPWEENGGVLIEALKDEVALEGITFGSLSINQKIFEINTALSNKTYFSASSLHAR